MVIALILYHWLSLIKTEELWQNPSYLVVSKEPICIEATIDVAKELIDAKGIDEFLKYYQILISDVSRIFAWHNIKFIVKEQNFWETGNLIEIKNTITETTPAYRKFVNDNYDSTSAHVLLVNINNTEANLGKSFINGICTNDAYAIVQAGSRANWDPLYAAQIFAHEIGHLLNFDHVDTSNTTCKCPWNNFCIMNPKTFYWSQTYPPAFDSCNIQNIISHVPSCLKSCSTDSYNINPPVCGNNNVEEGEDCDCGFEESCIVTGKRTCCNPKTCSFTNSQYQCASGVCCANCMFKRGNVCRQSTNECDIVDFCEGNSPNCPSNYKIDGVKCSNQQAYCISGTCMTKNAYCKELFPNSAVTYSEDCYKFASSYAAKNCTGLSSSNLVNLFCGTGKGICGQVYCNGPPSVDPFYKFSSGTLQCFTLLDSSETQYINKVPYGGVCGTNQVCYAGKCSSDTKIIKTCNKECRTYEECNGNGRNCVPNNPTWFQVYQGSPDPPE